MAALYGRLQGSSKEVTRCGTKNSGISARLETWQGSVLVTLDAEGSFHVTAGRKTCPKLPVAEGNIRDYT